MIANTRDPIDSSSAIAEMRQSRKQLDFILKQMFKEHVPNKDAGKTPHGAYTSPNALMELQNLLQNAESIEDYKKKISQVELKLKQLSNRLILAVDPVPQQIDTDEDGSSDILDQEESSIPSFIEFNDEFVQLPSSLEDALEKMLKLFMLTEDTLDSDEAAGLARSTIDIIQSRHVEKTMSNAMGLVFNSNDYCEVCISNPVNKRLWPKITTGFNSYDQNWIFGVSIEQSKIAKIWSSCKEDQLLQLQLFQVTRFFVQEQEANQNLSKPETSNGDITERETKFVDSYVLCSVERKRNLPSHGNTLHQSAKSQLKFEKKNEYIDVIIFGEDTMDHVSPSSDALKSKSENLSYDKPAVEYLTCEKVLQRNRIIQVTCSPYHTLVLNDLGAIFSCGNGYDGALGHGNNNDQKEPKLIDWFGQRSPPVVISQISCGGDILGSHSLVLSNHGILYTMGLGATMGNGTYKSSNTPVELAPSLDSEKKFPFKKVSSGGCFCLALSTSGDVYSWGKWANGRLGHGAIPYFTHARRRFRRKKIKSFQYLPKKITNLSSVEVVDISCGDGHALALSKDGEIYSWGKGNQGQLGNGFSLDSLVPVSLEIIHENWQNNDGLGNGEIAFFKSVECGSNFSMALDKNNTLWSWGGSGRSCLGHGDNYCDQIFQWTIGRNQRILGKNNVSLPKFDWMIPHPIECFKNNRNAQIAKVSAGEHHCAAVTIDGSLYLWGENTNKVLGLSSSSNDQQLLHPTLITDATHPSVDENAVEYVFCGNNKTILITTGSFLSKSFHDHLLDNTNTSIVKISNQHQNWPSTGSGIGKIGYFDEENFYDIALLVSGKIIYAHKVILASRCTVLRQLIREEERPGRPVELILSDIRYDIAALLVEFLYCDNFLTPLDAASLHGLTEAAVAFELPELHKVCTNLTPDDKENCDNHNRDLSRPSMQLSADILSALGDATWADIKFITSDEKQIYAHRCILISRSCYFRAMFTNGMVESQMKEFKVEESFIGMLRILTFIYSGHLPPTIITGDERDDILLDDLVAADRYSLTRMKVLCEHSIQVSQLNCIDTLVVAEIVSARHLKEVSLSTLIKYIGSISQSDAFQMLQQEYPTILEQILGRMKNSHNDMVLMKWSKEAEQSLKGEKEELFSKAPSIPLVNLMFLLLFAVAYIIVIQQVKNLGAIVPVLNITIFAAVMGFACVNLSRN